MRELVIVRHGLAYCNVAGVVGGPRSCVGLTDHGRAQVALLAERLRKDAVGGLPVTAVHASPRRRARETAEVVAAALGVPAQYDDQFREPCMGSHADGRRWVDLRAALSLSNFEFPDVRLAGGGESWTEYLVRVTGALRAVLASSVGRRVVVVGHAETVIAAYHLFLQCPPERPLPIDFVSDNAAITVWRTNNANGSSGMSPRWRLVSHNDTGHLAGLVQPSHRRFDRRSQPPPSGSAIGADHATMNRANRSSERA